jgi:hypothetical protein
MNSDSSQARNDTCAYILKEAWASGETKNLPKAHMRTTVIKREPK